MGNYYKTYLERFLNHKEIDSIGVLFRKLDWLPRIFEKSIPHNGCENRQSRMISSVITVKRLCAIDSYIKWKR